MPDFTLSAHNCGSADDLGTLAGVALPLMRQLRRNVCIETRYLGPTEHRGSRVSATMIGTKQRATVSYRHELNTDAAHLLAALQLLARWFEGEQLVCTGYTDTDRGFIFSFSHA